MFDEHIIVSGFDHPRMPVITNDRPNEIQHFRWGLLPTDLEDINDFQKRYNTLNAKAEEAQKSRLYSESFSSRRCLVLCSGFFEWQKVGKEKIPYYVSLKEDEMFVFAGLWNTTREPNGSKINTYAILTVEANELMARIHNTKKRMPLILKPETARQWLNEELTPNLAQEIMTPLPENEMKAHTIKKFVPSECKNYNSTDFIAYYSYPIIEDLMYRDNTLF
jgi:putative SOS response-associated peptidase YedK